MAAVYVTEPGTKVHKSSERLVLTRQDQVVDEIPMTKVDQLVLMGRGVSISTAALFALAQRGVDVVYLSQTGKFVSRMVGDEHKHSKLRYSQALAVANEEAALGVVKSIVLGKILNQRTLVQRLSQDRNVSTRALENMMGLARKVDATGNVDEVRGMEGMAAREYFGLLRILLRPPSRGSWGFEGRAYYPPPDPVNAMLSFGYTLLLKDFVAACQMIGLDPSLGFFHVIDYGRPSMALDLMEEFRPVIVDSIVLKAVNSGFIQPSDFEGAPEPDADEEDQPGPQNSKQGTWMKEGARKRFIEMYENRVNEQAVYALTSERMAYRRIFQLQAQQMARLILGEIHNYSPVTIR